MFKHENCWIYTTLYVRLYFCFRRMEMAAIQCCLRVVLFNYGKMSCHDKRDLVTFLMHLNAFIFLSAILSFSLSRRFQSFCLSFSRLNFLCFTLLYSKEMLYLCFWRLKFWTLYSIVFILDCLFYSSLFLIAILLTFYIFPRIIFFYTSMIFSLRFWCFYIIKF